MFIFKCNLCGPAVSPVMSLCFKALPKLYTLTVFLYVVNERSFSMYLVWNVSHFVSLKAKQSLCFFFLKSFFSYYKVKEGLGMCVWNMELPECAKITVQKLMESL